MAKDKVKDLEVVKTAQEAIKPDALSRVGQTLPTDININLAREKFAQIQAFQALVQSQLHDGLDYGIIPGTKKPTLLKAGAEKIAKLLDLADTFEILDRVEDWEKGFFFYRFKCILVSLLTGQTVSEGVGSCNSKEKKYRWNWATKEELPKGVDSSSLVSQGIVRTLTEFDFAINKAETAGKYGKPQEYWDRWQKAIKERRAKPIEKPTRDKKKMLQAWELEVDEVRYRIPNDDTFSIANTILKMAKKRAMVDACLSVGRLSELFTQDLEDTTDTHRAETSGHEPEAEPAEDTKPEAKPAAKAAAKAEAKPKAKAEPKPAEDFTSGGDEEAAMDDATAPPEKDLPAKPTDPKAETIKAIQAHLKIAFGKTYADDYKAFKDWLGNTMGPKLNRHFVGLDHGAWSLGAGDVEDLLFLYDHRNNSCEGFAKMRARVAAQKEEK